MNYTGYVVQPIVPIDASEIPSEDQPLILVSVGGGRFGHDLLESVVAAAPRLAEQLPHQIRVFTGPFCPDSVFESLHLRGAELTNLRIEKFTPNLVGLMQHAELSISMAGYNTTMNVLSTGVRAMMKAFTGNDDQEQRIRSQKLANLGLSSIIQPEDLEPSRLAEQVIHCLSQDPASIRIDLDGARNTALHLNQLLQSDPMGQTAA